ncbi:alkaline phosphatase family protein [Granulosicoccus sp.]|nr:alkaline phosphatase D family protein [Granulosicoccus sp.]MDB4222947.1 alkaline phosphatase family protein [Granulosicoccus sp.]
MINLYKPTVGPLLGYREYSDVSALQRVLVRGSKTRARQTCYFFVKKIDGEFIKIPPKILRGKDHDYTVMLDLKNLPLDTKFEYKVTIAKGRKKPPEYDLLKAKDCYRGVFETRNRNDSITSFVFGSCCHFSLVGVNQADDAAFKTMRNQWENGSAQDDFMLMLGDQIYGDHGDGRNVLSKIPGFRVGMLFVPVLLKRLINFKHYLNHYYKAFRKKDKRKVMATIPTYMMFDDHEVHNEWGSNNFLNEPEDYRILKDALRAYNIYQVSHPSIQVPTVPLPTSAQIEEGVKLPEAKYYYEYCHGKSGFFVLDTRFNKIPLNEKGSNKSKVRMISTIQMNALKKFLRSGNTSVKFIATGVPIAPDSKENDLCLTKIFDNSPEDRWEGFTTQRKEILDFINEENIKNVVFLSGDVHASYAFDIYENQNKRVIARQLTSSAFNWGVGLTDCNFGKYEPLKGANGMYRLLNRTGAFVTKDNFCRVVVKTNEAKVNFYHAKNGKSLREFSFPLE